MSKKGGERGGVIANPKKIIANLRILNGFSGKKRNVISKKGRGGGGGQGGLEVFQKNIHFWADGRPLFMKCLFLRRILEDSWPSS